MTSQLFTSQTQEKKPLFYEFLLVLVLGGLTIIFPIDMVFGTEAIEPSS